MSFIAVAKLNTSLKTENGPFLQSNYISSQGPDQFLNLFRVTKFLVSSRQSVATPLFQFQHSSLPLNASRSLPHASLFVSVNRL